MFTSFTCSVDIFLSVSLSSCLSLSSCFHSVCLPIQRENQVKTERLATHSHKPRLSKVESQRLDTHFCYAFSGEYIFCQCVHSQIHIFIVRHHGSLVDSMSFV